MSRLNSVLRFFKSFSSLELRSLDSYKISYVRANIKRSLSLVAVAKILSDFLEVSEV